MGTAPRKEEAHGALAHAALSAQSRRPMRLHRTCSLHCSSFPIRCHHQLVSAAVAAAAAAAALVAATTLFVRVQYTVACPVGLASTATEERAKTRASQYIHTATPRKLSNPSSHTVYIVHYHGLPKRDAWWTDRAPALSSHRISSQPGRAPPRANTCRVAGSRQSPGLHVATGDPPLSPNMEIDLPIVPRPQASKFPTARASTPSFHPHRACPSWNNLRPIVTTVQRAPSSPDWQQQLFRPGRQLFTPRAMLA